MNLFRNLTALSAVAISASGALFAPVANEVKPSDYAREALVNLLARSHVVVEADETYSFDEGSCIYAGFVKATKSVTITKNLNAAKSYMFVAGGDDGVVDVDIQVIYNGEVLAADELEDNVPAVEFQPEESGKYTIKVTLVDEEVDSFVALSVLSNDGWEIPVDRLDAVIDSLLNRVDEVSADNGGVFLEAANSWCIYGGVLDENRKSFSISNIILNGPPNLVLGAADDESVDLDLELVKGGKVVAEDKEDDNFPVVGVEEAGTYQVNLINEGGASLAMFTILEFKE